MAKGGKRPGAGRPKGAKDKISRDLKQLVLDTVDLLEKEEITLLTEAKKDPAWFFANFVKPMLPKGVVVSGEGENGEILHGGTVFVGIASKSKD